MTLLVNPFNKLLFSYSSPDRFLLSVADNLNIPTPEIHEHTKACSRMVTKTVSLGKFKWYLSTSFLSKEENPGMMAHTFNPSLDYIVRSRSAEARWEPSQKANKWHTKNIQVSCHGVAWMASSPVYSRVLMAVRNPWVLHIPICILDFWAPTRITH